MTCRACQHSVGRAADWSLPPFLWCVRHRTAAARVCSDFVREPGSDDE